MSTSEEGEVQHYLDRIEQKIDTLRLKLFAVTPSRQNQAIWVLAYNEEEALDILAQDMGYASKEVLHGTNPLARAIEHNFTRPCILPRAYDSV